MNIFIFNVLVYCVAFFQQGKCAYGIIIVAIFWMTECLPLAVTAIMPVVLMTWMGVMDSREICKNYLKVIDGCIFLLNPSICPVVGFFIVPQTHIQSGLI